jgi:CheY-like chemotaxis protein
VPVIYISGNDNPAVQKAALDSGCVAFLTKPFSGQELMEPLKRAGRYPEHFLTHQRVCHALCGPIASPSFSRSHLQDRAC